MPKNIKLFYDLETTGLDYKTHAIHDLSGLIEVDGKVVESFQYRVKPFTGAQLNPDALKLGNLTVAKLREFKEPKQVFFHFRDRMDKYVDRYNKQEKIWLVGYNNVRFDDDFLRAMFERYGDQYFGAYFRGTGMDVRVLAAEYLQDRVYDMPNFQLGTVAKELGIPVDSGKLHDAEYDLAITRKIYRIVTGREFEL